MECCVRTDGELPVWEVNSEEVFLYILQTNGNTKHSNHSARGPRKDYFDRCHHDPMWSR